MQKFIISLLFLSMPAFAEDVKDRNSQIGLALGTPGGLNLVLKSHLANHPVQLSAGYIGSDTFGLEAGYRFYTNEKSLIRSVQVIAGTAKFEDLSYPNDRRVWHYVGVSSTLQYGGFFVEPGLSVGSGDFTNPQLVLQGGWLWRL